MSASSSDDSPSSLGTLLARHKAEGAGAINDIILHCLERARKLAGGMLGRFASVPNEIETGDVVNELVVRLIPVLGEKTFDSQAQFLRYAALCIRSNLIDLAKKRRPILVGEAGSRSSAPSPLETKSDSTNDPSKLAQWGEIHQLIDHLPDEERVLFDLLYYQDLTQSEAADLLGIPLTTLRAKWLHARANFMRRLGNNAPF